MEREWRLLQDGGLQISLAYCCIIQQGFIEHLFFAMLYAGKAQTGGTNCPWPRGAHSPARGQMWKPLSHRVIRVGQHYVPGRMDQRREWPSLLGAEVREGLLKKLEAEEHFKFSRWTMHIRELPSPLSSLVTFTLLCPSWYLPRVCQVSCTPSAALLNLSVPRFPGL